MLDLQVPTFGTAVLGCSYVMDATERSKYSDIYCSVLETGQM